jgi:hypothetical protein
MSAILRIIIGLALLMHGIGHILFLIPALNLAVLKTPSWGQSTRSWLLSNLLGDGFTRTIAVILWLLVIGAYLAGTFGFFTNAPWWPAAVIAASIASAVGLLLFWANPPQSPNVSALVFDSAALVSLIFFQWPGV